VSLRIINPKIIASAGNKPKEIAEYIGRVASGDTALSIAKMVSPSGWLEVEDGDAVRRVATRVLEKFGYTVVAAADVGKPWR
jgi:hypothetical protein